MEKVKQVRAALAAWGRMDPCAWNTGLSPAGARLAQEVAVDLALADSLERPGCTPPSTLVIWCASNVFTAPLEWTALFCALGSRVVLKAPSSCPGPTLALAEAFSNLGVEAYVGDHTSSLQLLEDAQGLLAFGSDEALAQLDRTVPPGLRRSLHGHRISFAVVSGDATAASGLVEDAVLHDGRGCMSPAAVFCLGDPGPLTEAMASALAQSHSEVPPGPLEPWQGPEWRRRIGLTRALGSTLEGSGWAVTTSAPREVGLGALPRLMAVHPISDLSVLEGLSQLPLSTCATDLEDTGGLGDLGFHRICTPGAMQRPPLDRAHDGVDLVSHFSVES